MEFAKTSGFHGHERSRNLLGRGEILAVHDADFACRGFLTRSHGVKLKRVAETLGSGFGGGFGDIRLKRFRTVAAEDLKGISWKLCDGLGRQPEILREHLRRSVRCPIGKEESALLREVALVEDEQKLAAIVAEALNRMRISRREKARYPPPVRRR